MAGSRSIWAENIGFSLQIYGCSILGIDFWAMLAGGRFSYINVLIYIWTKTDFAKDVGLPSNWGCWYPKITTSIVFFFGGGGVTGPCSFFFSSGIMLVAPKIDCQLLFPSVYFLQNRHIEITWPTMLPNWSWSFSIVCDEFDTSTTCQRSINWHLVSFFHLQLSWYFSKNPTVQPMKCLEASTFL